MQKSEESLCELWDSTRRNKHNYWNPRREREKGAEAYLKKKWL